MLLTSLVFAVSAVALARRHVLVQELPAVEGLARVDVICLDKTGTLTEGTPQFGRIEPLNGGSDLDEVLGAFAAASPSENSTMLAISTAFPTSPDWKVEATVPFSSARKWSAVSFTGHGSWVLGAPEVLLREASESTLREKADSLARSGLRVLLLSRAEEPVVEEELPQRLDPAALLVIEEKIRPDAAETLEYFMDQGVGVRVISGDNPSTVGSVAERVGVPGADEPVDARKLPADLDDLSEVMHESTVFGRVVPEQKRMMVHALQSGRPRGGHDRGRRQRYPRPQGRGHGHRHGLGRPLDQVRGPTGAPRRQVLDPAAGGGGGPAGDGQHGEGGQPLPDQDRLCRPARGGHRHRHLAVPVPAPPYIPGGFADHRHPGFLALLRAQQEKATGPACCGGSCISPSRPGLSRPPPRSPPTPWPGPTGRAWRNRARWRLSCSPS